MLKVIGRTLIILLVAIAIGWASIPIMNSLPQSTQRGEFRDGGGPGFAPAGNLPPRGFGGEGEFRERGGFGPLGSLLSIGGHVILFAAMTLVVVLIGKLIPKKRAEGEKSDA